MRPNSCQGGQAVVETALAIIVFMAVVMGVIDLGRAAYTYNGMSNAAREASHHAMIEYTSDSQSPCFWNGFDSSGCLSAIKSYVAAQGMSPGLSTGNLSVGLSTPCRAATQCSLGMPLSISISTQFQPVAASLLGVGPFPVSASSTDQFILPPSGSSPTPTPSPGTTPQPSPTVGPEGPPSNVVVNPASGCTSNCQTFNISWNPPQQTATLGHYDVSFGNASAGYQYSDPVPPELGGNPVTGTTIDIGSQVQSICVRVYAVFSDDVVEAAVGSWNAPGQSPPSC